jgi:tyrosinase
MTLPEDAQLLGATSGALEVKGSGADTVVRLSADGQRKLASVIGDAAAGHYAGGIYLALENVRGAFDAAVLNTYINVPEGARPVDHRNLMAESSGLYGLRQASAGQGLMFLLEITQILTKLYASHSLNREEIRVSIVPDRPLPDSITITIGRMTIFAVAIT